MFGKKNLMQGEDLNELTQKINRKFIRNVHNPMRVLKQMGERQAYQIPSSSELFATDRLHVGEMHQPFNPGQYLDARPPHDTPYIAQALPAAPMPIGAYPETRVQPRYMAQPLPGAVPTNEGYGGYGMGNGSGPNPMPTHPPSPPAPDCVSICRHVQNCPVCSQLYRPQTGIYLTVIAILVIIILFLLKKIFDF